MNFTTTMHRLLYTIRNTIPNDILDNYIIDDSDIEKQLLIFENRYKMNTETFVQIFLNKPDIQICVDESEAILWFSLWRKHTQRYVEKNT